jgi:phage head maturation protease
LSTDVKGLRFRTLLPETSYARDLAVSVGRGDVTECSFGFSVNRDDPGAPGDVWKEIPDPEDDSRLITVRELCDLDLYDVSTVTYPAYPTTSAGVERSLWPEGIPAEVRAHAPGSRAIAVETQRWRERASMRLRLARLVESGGRSEGEYLSSKSRFFR